MSSLHDKQMLVLLYKRVFADEYPQGKFEIILDPPYRPIDTLPFKPDILISQDGKLVKWIEIGHLTYEKGRMLIDAIGSDVFCHIPYSHPIFDIKSADKADKLCLTNGYDIIASLQMAEVTEVKQALKANRFHFKKTATFLNLTLRQLSS